MRRVIFLLAVVLLFCLPVQADINSWIWADSDSIAARIGFDIADSNNVEAGVSALWFPDDWDPEIWGIYGVYHLGAIELPNPIPIDFLPETLSGRPYLGGKVDIDFEIDKARASPIVGIVFQDIIFIEYQFESIDRVDYNDSKVVFGLRIEF